MESKPERHIRVSEYSERGFIPKTDPRLLRSVIHLRQPMFSPRDIFRPSVSPFPLPPPPGSTSGVGRLSGATHTLAFGTGEWYWELGIGQVLVWQPSGNLRIGTSRLSVTSTQACPLLPTPSASSFPASRWRWDAGTRRAESSICKFW